MDSSGPAAIDELLSCERCKTPFTVLRSKETNRTRLTCDTCGESRDLIIAPATAGRWLVVEPGGRMSQYTSWNDLAGSRVSVPEEPAPLSGAALLDMTPTPIAPKLALADSDRDMAAAAPASEEPVTPRMEDKEPEPETPRRPSDEPEPLSSRDMLPAESQPGSEETQPLSTRDIMLEVKMPELPKEARVSKAPPMPERASRAPERPSKIDAPTRPVAGALKTLPPKAGAPPPTIHIEDGPKSRRSSRPARAVAQKDGEEEKKNNWVLPVLGLFVAAGIVWLLTRDSTPPETPQPTPAVTETAPPPTAAPSETTPPAVLSSTSTPSAAPSTTPSATPSATVATPVASGAARHARDVAALSLPELLERASAARRSGNRAGAKELYDKILEKNPANVEAHAGLAEIARANGDLRGAKDEYTKALATSPGYSPAILGLADVEWDLGEKAAARTHYMELAARMGASAPPRVNERLSAEP